MEYHSNSTAPKSYHITTLADAAKVDVSDIYNACHGAKRLNPEAVMRIIVALAPRADVAYAIMKEATYNLECKSIYRGYNDNWPKYLNLIEMLTDYRCAVDRYTSADVAERYLLFLPVQMLRNNIISESNIIRNGFENIEILYGSWIFK